MAEIKKREFVKINNKVIEMFRDEEGTLRFPCNRIITHFLRSHYQEIAELAQDGMVSQDERRFIYQNNGYSLCGYGEIFPDDDIEEDVDEEDQK